MRVVVHHHGAELIPFFEGAGRTTQRWVERIARGADLNIVLGDRWRAFLIQSVGVEPERVAVLFNATPKAGRPAEPRDPAAGGVRFLLLATLLPRKGISEFLQALSNLRREGLDVSAVLAGNGEIDRYRKEAALLGLADLCTFAGWVDRAGVDQVLTQADALVLPSYEEGLPMAILEALSASLPVVATRVGSIPEVLKDGETALLVEAKDVLQLTAAMRRIATDAGLRATLAKNGLALFSELFEMDPYMTKMLALYDKVNLASPRPVSSS